MREVLRYCESRHEPILHTIETLVRLESPSNDKSAVDRCGDAIAALLAAAGGSVERLRQSVRGDHIVARFPGASFAGAHSAGADRPSMILGHFDTVWPVGTLERMPVRRQGDRLYGPGVFDMKAGIAIALAALDALRATGTSHPSVVVVLTSDEEIGSETSRALIEAEAQKCRAVYVLEPALPGGALKTARKGCGEFEVIVHGVAAHAGLDPGKGASAIHELAAQIAAIERLQDLPNGISVNVGVISGGTRPNVVAEQARAIVDARAPTREAAARVESAMRNLQPVRAGTRLTINGGFERPPMESTAASRDLFERARAISSSLGRDLGEGSAGGGSDGNFTAAVGVPTLDGLGAVGDGAHAAHEHIDMPSMPWRAALLAGLLCTMNLMPNGLKTALLLGLLSGVLLSIGQLLGGANGLVIGLVFAVVMNFGSYWFSDKIVLRMYRAQEVAPGHRLYGMVERLSRNAQLPMPKVYIIPDPSPNAFATGRNPSHAAVAATEGIMQVLNDNELEGVIAHELAHIQNRDILISSVAATIAAAITMAAQMAQYAAIFGGLGGRDDRDRGSNPIAMLATIILAPIAAMLIQMAISRSREFSADAGGARIAGNPYGLADALRKIEAVSRRVPLDANPATAHMFIMKPFSGGGLANLFSSHPPTEDRIRALMGGGIR